MKKIFCLSFLLLFFYACEDEFNQYEAGFLNHQNFQTVAYESEISFRTESVSGLVSNVQTQALLGVYEEPHLGTLKASLVSQLSLPSTLDQTARSYGADTLVTSSMDGVVMYIPYQATPFTNEAGEEIHSLDSIFGAYDAETRSYEPFDLEVYELETFLNSLDPSNPSKANVFKTDDEYATGALLAQATVSPSTQDTVSYVQRKLEGDVYDTDTIRLSGGGPYIAIPLASDSFETKILDRLPASGAAAPTSLSSQEDFIRHFKGLYLKTVSETAGSIASLQLSDAFVEMYYTNLVTTTEGAVVDTIKTAKTFPFGGVKASQYHHDHDRETTADKIYLQGASGFRADLSLFGNDPDVSSASSVELDSLRNEALDAEGRLRWLINEASLRLYVDETYWEQAKDTVFRLFLYKKKEGYNAQLLDYISQAASSDRQGKFQKGENGPPYYEFFITDYIRELLLAGDARNSDLLGLKVFTPGDLPTTTIDTMLTLSNWDPRGVVLSGGQQDAQDPYRALLKINYTTQIDE